MKTGKVDRESRKEQNYKRERENVIVMLCILYNDVAVVAVYCYFCVMD